MSSGSSYGGNCASVSARVQNELCANYLELSLKFGEPSTKDENFLWALVIALKLLAPVVIFLRMAIKEIAQW